MILQPTMKLRWLNRPIEFDMINSEKVLQQWWQEINSPNGVWKDIEVVDLKYPLTPDECFKKEE